MFATLELPLRDDSRHKRLKVGRACHPCRMKKIKCDGKQPCMQCKARRRKCMYLKNTDETYIKLDPVQDNIPDTFLQDIAERAQEQQQRHQRQLQQQRQNVEQHSQHQHKHLVVGPGGGGETIGVPEAEIYIANSKQPDTLFATSSATTMGNNHNNSNSSNNCSSHTSNPDPSGCSLPQPHPPTTRPDKMIEQLADGLVRLTLHNEPVDLDDDTVSPWRNYGDFVRWTPEPSLPGYYTAPIDMPSRAIQENLINAFFAKYHHTLPTLSRGMFFDQLHVKGPLITPLLLNIMYAHAAKHHPMGFMVDDPAPYRSQQDDPAAAQSLVFYNRARRLLDDFLDVPRVSTVIALLYMAAYEYDRPYTELGSSRSSRAWMYSGMAVRMCLELGLHTANYSSQMSQFDIELRKRVLWTCYVMDKLESCMTERPWMLRAKDISLDFPASLPEDTPEERMVLDGFGQLCRLTILMERVLNTFAYEYKNKQMWTMAEENQTLTLLKEVATWREHLPANLQWTPNHHLHQHQRHQHHSGTDGSAVTLSHVAANLHLVCSCLELSLVMCCRYQDDRLHRERRHTLAGTITHLVSLTVEHPRLMYTCTVSAFAAIFAALTHVADFDHPVLQLAEDARLQFRKSLEDLSTMLQHAPMRNFDRLLDLTHAILSNGGTNNTTRSYANAFSAIQNICHSGTTTASSSTTTSTKYDQHSPIPITSNTSTVTTSVEAAAAAAAAALGFDPAVCLPHTSSPSMFAAVAAAMNNNNISTTPSPPPPPVLTTSAVSSNTAAVAAATARAAAARAAAAAAVGAVGPPTSGPPKSIEPADYTFELISVADEWARALLYPPQ